MSENKYWTKRHYDYTSNIKEGVSGMNEDIRELSVDSYYKFKDLSEFDDIKKIIFEKDSDK